MMSKNQNVTFSMESWSKYQRYSKRKRQLTPTSARTMVNYCEESRPVMEQKCTVYWYSYYIVAKQIKEMSLCI
jgi:hypothetical protein